MVRLAHAVLRNLTAWLLRVSRRLCECPECTLRRRVVGERLLARIPTEDG